MRFSLFIMHFPASFIPWRSPSGKWILDSLTTELLQALFLFFGCLVFITRLVAILSEPPVWMQTSKFRWIDIFSCDQAGLRTPLYVRLSVRLSVTPFSLCFYHRIITNSSRVITKDKSNVYAEGQGHMSKVKVTKVITQLSGLRTVTPDWIHIWWWNYA